MAQCTYCNAETEIYAGGDVPICVECSDALEARRKPPASARNALIQRVAETTARANAASEAFSSIMSQFPSGLPYVDGAQRIHSASRELSVARKEMMNAQSRLNDLIERGIVPEDLKRSG
jgi:hypothetical protein